MKKLLTILFFSILSISLFATTYTRVGAKPDGGWAGTYLLVYQPSETEAYVWNNLDESNNFVRVSVSGGKITADNLDSYQLTINQESSNEYGIRVSSGFLATNAKKNCLLTDGRAAQVCALVMNSGYTDITTNSGTQKLLYNTSDKRFRFYYDQNKQWKTYQHVYLYALGDNEVIESGNTLDINYAHAAFYACQSKFSPTREQYYYVELYLAQEESYDAVPQVGLTILAPTPYSIAGTYKSSAYYQDGKAYYIHETGGSAYSYIIFPSKEGGTQGSIKEAVMTITPKGESQQLNAYLYNVNLTLTDSNKKIWELNKDLNIYAWWTDCDRTGKEPKDMAPVAFTLESGNHEPAGKTTLDDVNGNLNTNHKRLVNGQLLIEYNGVRYDVWGRRQSR